MLDVEENLGPKFTTDSAFWMVSAILLSCALLMGCGAMLPSTSVGNPPPVETVTISDRKVIESDGNYNGFPSIEKAANGELVLVYRKGTNHVTTPQVILRRSSDEGMSWSPETEYFETSSDDPTLALMPDGSLLYEEVSVDANNSAGAAWSLSRDNGNTWSPFQFFSDPATSTYALPTRFVTVNDEVYGASYSQLGNRSINAALWKTSDNGSTWKQQSTIQQSGDADINETAITNSTAKKFLAISRDDANVNTWGHFSNDGGFTWGSQIDYTPQVGVLQLPQLVRTPKVLLLFGRQYDPNTSPAHEMVVFASYDSGLTFADRTVLDTYTGYIIDGGYCWPLLKGDGSIFLVYYADSNNLHTPDIKSLVLHWGKTHR